MQYREMSLADRRPHELHKSTGRSRGCQTLSRQCGVFVRLQDRQNA